MRMRVIASISFFSAMLFASAPTYYDDSPYRLILEKRDLEVASKWQFFFEVTGNSKAENEAQYYLFLGQPRRAYKAIENISDPAQKSLFQAVLFALVSTPRKEEEVEQLDPKSVNSDTTWVFPVEDGEIWPDEWEDLTLSNTGGRAMPIVQTAESQKEFQEEAKRLFETLEPSAFLRDFNVVALAMDVGAEIPEPGKVLRTFSSEQGSPYYARLQKLSGVKLVEGMKQKSFTKKSLELQLTDLKLTLMDAKAHAVVAPFLLHAWEGR